MTSIHSGCRPCHIIWLAKCLSTKTIARNIVCLNSSFTNEKWKETLQKVFTRPSLLSAWNPEESLSTDAIQKKAQDWLILKKLTDIFWEQKWMHFCAFIAIPGYLLTCKCYPVSFLLVRWRKSEDQSQNAHAHRHLPLRISNPQEHACSYQMYVGTSMNVNWKTVISISMYRSSPFPSTLNRGYITCLGMCKICTEAVHSVAL